MTERMHYLDTLRAAMMVLGIAFHAGLIYSEQSTWIVTDLTQSKLITWITYWTHVFRMPAFFIVAGFFCAFLYARLDVKEFIKVRLNRLGIPLLMTALTLNFAQYLIIHPKFAVSSAVVNFFADGEYVQHLWFLINLLLYSLLFLILSTMSGKRVQAGVAKAVTLIGRFPVYLLLLLLPFASIAIYALNKVGFPLYAMMFSSVSVFMLMLYIPYFLFGLALFYNPEIYGKWVRAHLLPLAVLSTGIFVLQHIVRQQPDTLGVLKDAATVYLQSALSWTVSAFVFALFYRAFQRPSNWGRRISEASYTIYLFHHVIVVALGTAMLSWQIPVTIKYLAVCMATFTITLMIHEKLINKSRVLKWVFSGIWVGRYLAGDKRSEQSR